MVANRTASQQQQGGGPLFMRQCLNETHLLMHGSDLEWYLQRYVFPCLVVFGILGNALNLTVLLNRRMHSRANTFLAMLAFADIVFLSLLVPNILANYSMFSLNFLFRSFYLNAKVHLLSFANWASAVALWCVIAVCADRLIGIRNPLFARTHVPRWKMASLFGSIVLVPGLLTAHQHLAYTCLVREFCNGTQLYSKCLPVNQDHWFGNKTNPHSDFFRRFISVSILLNVVFNIILPIVCLVLLNTMLLCALRKRSRHLNSLNQHDNIIKPSQSSSADGLCQHLLHAKTEQRVTLTVTLIVSMFTLTNGPSAVVHLLQTLLMAVTGRLEQRDWYNLTLVCSSLVIFGKASNFILFCLCSKHFRRRLFALAQKKVHEKLGSLAHDRRRSSYTPVSTVTRKWTGASQQQKSSVAQSPKGGIGPGGERRVSHSQVDHW